MPSLAASMKGHALKWVAAEISTLSRYYSHVAQWKPRESDGGVLLEALQSPSKSVVSSLEELRSLCAAHESVLVLLNGNTNYDLDIQATLAEIGTALNRSSRVVLVCYNGYLEWTYRVAQFLRLRKDEMPTTFLTRASLSNLAQLAGFEVVRSRPACLSVLNLGKLTGLINRLAGLTGWSRTAALTEVMVLRPLIPEEKPLTLSIVVPTRNEKGNIQAIFERMPVLDKIELEVIFVEGHSKDGTWEEIQHLIPNYRDRYSIQAYQQTGVGKCDAVRLGFSKASGDLLTILDADLTMPPELLGRFTDCYRRGLGDFINGNRLVYPMEGKAMRFLNRLGNIFFAKALSTVLEVNLGDSLCGTKLMTRHAYAQMTHWRRDFGDFDPFGDFELLFPAATLGLGIFDLPIRYRDRTYGTTNISRFRHGWILLKMTCVGLTRIRLSPPA